MRIYLARHGDALVEAVDATRPLSARGRGEIERVARLAAELGFRPGGIWHSGLLRARQTAEILATRLTPAEGVHGAAGLAPSDDPARIATECEVARTPLMLVGHLPHLGRLASLLLTGDPGRELIRFETGTIAALTRGAGGFQVECIIRPDMEGSA